MNEPEGQLKRELGVPGAVITGLGSILGTGVFVSIGIAAGVAGDAVALAIVVAAVVAICNGLSSAQLAANHPVSGGTYEYGHRWLNSTLGFLAGWTFLWAKSASAATAALGFASYVLVLLTQTSQNTFLVPVALSGLVVLTIVVLVGIRRTSQVNVFIVGITVLSLVTFIAMRYHSAALRPLNMADLWPAADSYASFARAVGLMFVAYTGYGRIATLGEEVKSPRRTIPIAVIVTLGVSMLLYFLVAITALQMVDAKSFAGDPTQSGLAPLVMVSYKFGQPGLPEMMTLGAVTAMLGVLLNLLLGLSRVLLAMGRRGDMPRVFARVGRESGVPWTATIAIAVLIGAMVCIGSVKLAWSFSAFTVLIYYAITNACALRLTKEERLYPRFIPVLGLVWCLSLSFWVEPAIWYFGVGLLGLGLLWHVAARWLSGRAKKV